MKPRDFKSSGGIKNVDAAATFYGRHPREAMCEVGR